MDLPTPPAAVAALAAFVRDRLSTVSDAVAPLLGRRDAAEALPAAARQLALVIVGAAAPFASTSYSRARLIRQMHASGLLSAEEARRTTLVLELQPEPEHGAPN
jgi:hypothetical protein